MKAWGDSSAAKRDLDDPEDRNWTLDMAADHAGISRKTVVKWVRQGMPLKSRILGGVVDREVFLAEFRRRRMNQMSHLFKSTEAEP